MGGRLHVGVSHVFCLTVPIVRRYLAKEIKGGRGKEKEKQAERKEKRERKTVRCWVGARGAYGECCLLAMGVERGGGG